MVEYQEGHPCNGKDCNMCETCIFDEELFPRKNNVNLKNMCERKVCNGCTNLIQCRDSSSLPGRFDVACREVAYEAFGQSRPRRIDFNVTEDYQIGTPFWCPLKKENKEKLALPAQITRPRPQETGPRSTTSNPTYTSYSDRREKMKELKRHLEWHDIKEGHVYVIPRILNQSRKIVKVITKTAMSCICHEISEITGSEYTYNTTVYPSDLDAIFITEMHKF